MHEDSGFVTPSKLSANTASLRKELYYQSIAQPQHPFEGFDFFPNCLSAFYPKTVQKQVLCKKKIQATMPGS